MVVIKSSASNANSPTSKLRFSLHGFVVLFLVIAALFMTIPFLFLFTNSPAEVDHWPKKAGRQPRVLVQTIATGGGRGTILSHTNQKSYCHRWGYDYRVVDHALEPKVLPKCSAHWQKLPATIAAMDERLDDRNNGEEGGKRYDHIFWVDADAFFPECGRSLDPLLQRMDKEGSSWLFSGGNGLVITSGQVLWRNNDMSRRILAEVSALWYPRFNDEQKLFENGAFCAYLGGTRKPNRDELKIAYNVADKCYVSGKKHKICDWVQQCEGRRALEEIGTEGWLRNATSMVPRVWINAYLPREVGTGTVVYHCAGQRDKQRCLQDFLAETGRNMKSLDCGADV